MLLMILYFICFKDGQTLSWFAIVSIFLSVNSWIFSVSKRCSVLCTGRYTTKNELYNKKHCVGFNITFNWNTNYPTKLQDVPCGISGRILEVIDFECFDESLRNRNQGRDTECTGNSDFEFIPTACRHSQENNIIHSFYSDIFLKSQW